MRILGKKIKHMPTGGGLDIELTHLLFIEELIDE